ncbi:MAG TPA: M56 family metallopeptidase [Thermoanaerobaculia bacterium]|jgi:beta-lactamase regulating signal transducer with metallopeptidase domain|nr:M56 family metallopeptidase [Thermoanaerobaculia bacterium]
MTTLFELAARLQAANAAEGLLWMAVKATLILAIARLLLAAMPRASAAMKHVVATAALIAVAAMPLATLVLPSFELSFPVTRDPLPAQSGPSETARATGNGQRTTVGLSDNEPIATAISVAKATGIADRPITAIQRAANVARSTWKGMIVVTLGIVALLMLVHMLLGMIGVWFVARDAEELTSDAALKELDYARGHLALERDVRLLRSARVAVPIVWGFFRPVLLLPVDVVTWPAERLRVVLLHELAHLKRWDGISLILTRAAVALFWFHPIAWSLERAGRSECERACDDLVLASGTKPSVYADHLLEIARTMPVFDPFRSVTLAMSRKTQLEGRLLSILQKDVARRVFTGRRVAIACALAVAVIVPVSALRLIARPSEEKTVKPVIQEETLKSDAEVEVKPEIEAIGDFLLAKLGKYDKRADRWIREPRNAEERYERAYDLYHNERYDEAAVAFRLAADEGYRPATAYYNAACSYALIGDIDRSLAELDRAIDAGWDDFDHIADDSDFDPIRSDGRFRTMLESKLSDVATRRETEAVEKLHELKGKKVSKRNADDWFDVGMDLLRLRKLDDSIDAFQKAIDAGEKVGAATYNIACAYSLKGDARNGMTWLDKAVENGFSDEDKFENDPDIAFLRTQSGFDRLKEKAEDLEMRGCCDGPVSFLFDNWKDAVQHHRAMVKKHPSSGRAWFNLGFTALQARDYATGKDAFQHALALNYRVGTSSYNMACAFALQGDRDSAFEWLQRAESEGFEVADHARHDDDLDSLHRDSRWKF